MFSTESRRPVPFSSSASRLAWNLPPPFRWNILLRLWPRFFFLSCLGSYLSLQPCGCTVCCYKWNCTWKKGVERLLSDCTDGAKCFCKMCGVFLLTLSFFLYVSWQDSDKCFICNSQEPYNADYRRNSHLVENVIYQRDSRGELTWWQSVNGVWMCFFDTKSPRPHNVFFSCLNL